MRNGLLVATSFILISSGMLHARNYFPLAVGNRWEYIDEARNRRVTVEATGVDEIDHKKWFKIRWLDGTERWLQVDEQGQLLELDRRKGNEVVWVNFWSPLGKTYRARNSVGLRERIQITIGGPKSYTLVSARIAGHELSF